MGGGGAYVAQSRSDGTYKTVTILVRETDPPYSVTALIASSTQAGVKGVLNAIYGDDDTWITRHFAIGFIEETSIVAEVRERGLAHVYDGTDLVSINLS
jgi:hypothetical protein